ncbi:UNVERIFIED_ORG: hypothetical protein BCL66_105258 [Martelella mediterranea]
MKAVRLGFVIMSILETGSETQAFSQVLPFGGCHSHESRQSSTFANKATKSCFNANRCRREQLNEYPADRAAQAIIHIGLPKTGSTVLQDYLCRHRRSLAESGVIYPEPLNSSGHHAELLLVKRQTDPDAQLLWHQPATLAANNVEDGWGYLKSTFRPEKGEARHSQKIIFSSEGLFEELDSPECIAPLARLFEGVDVRIVFYIRRIDRLIRADVLEYTKVTSSISDEVIKEVVDFRISEHDEIEKKIEYWEDAFGSQSLSVRPYDKTSLIDGDIVADFMSVAGIAAPATPREKVEANVSLAVETVYFMGDWLSYPIWNRSSFEGLLTGILMEPELQTKLSSAESEIFSPAQQRSFVDRFQPMYRRFAEKYNTSPDFFTESKPDDLAPSRVFKGLTYENSRPIFEYILKRLDETISASQRHAYSLEEDVNRLNQELQSSRSELKLACEKVERASHDVEKLNAEVKNLKEQRQNLAAEIEKERLYTASVREFRPDRTLSNLWRFLRKKRFQGAP